MNVLITGAQFGNKGAQSMLFTVVNEVRDRYPNADFFYLPLDYYKEECFQNLENYRFHFVVDDKAGQDFPTKFGAPQVAFRNANIRKILRNAQRHGEVLALSKLWDKLDVLIDVSGYSLTSKFGISSINRVLRMIHTAKAHGVKTILMPQSYGPFDFSEDVCKKIGAALKEVDLLFAREEDGVKQLRECCGVENKAILSPDIVLQAKEIDWKNVFTKEPELRYPVLKTSGNVGIVPNGETVRNGKHDVVLSAYRTILAELRAAGKEVYIFRHSNDLPLCREIYELVKDDAHCHLIEDEIDCLSYGPFVRQFDFIVASRFHSIVHAYREHVPALVLGWAIKYQALTALLGQEQYAFDITAKDAPALEQIQETARTMMMNHVAEAKTIEAKVRKLQQESCFTYCWSIMESQDAGVAEKWRHTEKMSVVSKAKQSIRPLYRAQRQKRLNNEYLKAYQKYAFDETGVLMDEKQYEACITRLYHTIEKGLAFPEYRPGFGKSNLDKLLRQMEAYAAKYDTEAFFYRTALSCLQAYLKKNALFGHDSPELQARVAKLPGVPNDCGGVIDVKPTTAAERDGMDYASFVKSRHSVRHFSSEPVDLEKTKAAICLAQHTPSACNRQGWKARIVADKEVLSKLLSNQNGNRGFGEEIDQMIVVTSDLRYFNQERELHQVFIDGGMYAQSIIQALHHEGLAMIPLSASLWEEQDRAVRELLHIEDAEMLIMFIGVGNYPPECLTTRSERKPAQITVI